MKVEEASVRSIWHVGNIWSCIWGDPTRRASVSSMGKTLPAEVEEAEPVFPGHKVIVMMALYLRGLASLLLVCLDRFLQSG